MASRTDKGKLVRKYFIEMEKYAHYKMFEEGKQLVEKVREDVLNKKVEHFFAIENAKISINTLYTFFDIVSESAQGDFKTILLNSKIKVKSLIDDTLHSFNSLQDEAAKGDDILEEFKQSRKKFLKK